MHCKNALGSNIPSLAVQGNSIFHMWRSFQYDENTDTIDSYILKVKQVASLLNYGEPEILELFKNMLPNKLYWTLFPINNLREAVKYCKKSIK